MVYQFRMLINGRGRVGVASELLRLFGKTLFVVGLKDHYVGVRKKLGPIGTPYIANLGSPTVAVT